MNEDELETLPVDELVRRLRVYARDRLMLHKTLALAPEQLARVMRDTADQLAFQENEIHRLRAERDAALGRKF